MILFIIRFFRGFVAFDVSGRFPERFINLLNRRGISYWDILPKKGGYKAKMFARDYRKIHSLARKAEVKLRLEKKSGVPFLIKRFKPRAGLAAGAVIALIIMMILGQFIWEVDVDGLSRISQSEMNSALSECGLVSGALKASVDTDAVERQLMLKLPEIRWISINALNNIAKIQIKEKSKKPKAKTAAYPCNIKAEYDGVITKTIVYSGALKTQKGSAVTRNQLLVSSIIENADEKLTYVHSSADIYADIFLSKNIRLSKYRTVYIPQKNYTEKSSLSFLWFTLPDKLSASHGFTSADNFYSLNFCVNGVNLPITENLDRRFYFDKKKVTLDFATAEKILLKKLALYECFSQPKSAVKEREYKILESGGEFLLKSSYTFNKNIAVTQRINIE